jgi:hypothetical protein
MANAAPVEKSGKELPLIRAYILYNENVHCVCTPYFLVHLPRQTHTR